ncbi:MAG: ferrous iron transport protein B, partial [candidate division Zixibacteria bacterium]|nr:ferrous iron transport protein B [candidate division Zixibacteria bacterium]
MSEPSCAHQPVSQAHIRANGRARRIALCGNPNSGKSTIFNHLTGLNQKVANYPGVTVESRVGRFTLPDNQDIDFDLIDVPGSYSLAAISPDEFIAVKTLIGSDDSSGDAPDLVIVVLDASNLDRSLYLLAQISEARLPTIVVLNQIDIAESRCLRINTVRLSQIIGMPVVSTVAHRGKGINRLKERIARFAEIPPAKSLFTFDHEIEEFLVEFSPSAAVKNSHLSRPELIRALFDKHGPAEKKFLGAYGSGGESKLEHLRRRLADKHRGLPFAEAYPLARKMAQIAQQVTITLTSTRNPATEKIDKVVLHRFWGPLILLGIMIIVFQSIFSWAEPLMDLIDSGAGFVAAQASALLPAGALRSLVVDGVIGGVGSVIIFLPQIVILFFFLGLLEDSGYLPRAAFIVDRLFRWCGLSGKSFVPLLSSFACAIPGIMATRTIDSPRQRLLTIVVAPLMSCSARLPIYIIMISAFVPYERYLGLFNSQGLTMVGLYSLGIITAVIVS